MTLIIAASVVAVQLGVACAGANAEFPREIDATRHYVFYSHGLIVEGQDPKPVHDRWGVYDFPAVVSRLEANAPFILIAHHRAKNTDATTYARKLASWVRKLDKAGVQPERITLVGFSRGGQITALAADELKPMKVNIVLLATCWDGGVQDQPAITVSGRLLSIYEKSDMAQSCKKLAERSTHLVSFQEIAISTDLEHGAFFRPLPQWVEPLLDWIAQN